MALDVEQVVDIPGLSGEEIIIDLCEQVAAKLRNDCNLRGADSYVNGYSAVVTVKISCYGIDTAEVDQTLNVKSIPTDKTDGPEKKVELEDEIIVKHEDDLTAVRARSDQRPPDVESKANEEPAKPGDAKGTQRRRYGSAPRVAAGGAQDIELPDAEA